jgi:hypothetical protein
MTVLVAWLLFALPSGAQATVRVLTQPGVEVLWEGVSLGSTDGRGVLEIEGVPSGSFSVTLRKPGHQTRTTRIEVDSRTERLETRLERVAGSAAAQPPSAPKPAPRPAAEAAPAAAVSEPGRARTASTPPTAPPSRKPVVLSVALLLVAAAAACLALYRRRHQAMAPPDELEIAPMFPLWEPAGAPDLPGLDAREKQLGGPDRFLEDLKRREREGDQRTGGRLLHVLAAPKAPADVIEAEFREVADPESGA